MFFFHTFVILFFVAVLFVFFFAAVCFPTAQFTRFLKRDYGRWAEGDDDRAAVASAEESLIASDV